jgi:hypothetical protein
MDINILLEHFCLVSPPPRAFNVLSAYRMHPTSLHSRIKRSFTLASTVVQLQLTTEMVTRSPLQAKDFSDDYTAPPLKQKLEPAPNGNLFTFPELPDEFGENLVVIVVGVQDAFRILDRWRIAR